MFRDFVAKNEVQLTAIGLPKQLRPVVFHKILNDIDDADAAFCARRVDDDFSVVARDDVSLQPYGDAFVGSFVRSDPARAATKEQRRRPQVLTDQPSDVKHMFWFLVDSASAQLDQLEYVLMCPECQVSTPLEGRQLASEIERLEPTAGADAKLTVDTLNLPSLASLRSKPPGCKRRASRVDCEWRQERVGGDAWARCVWSLVPAVLACVRACVCACARVHVHA